MDLNEEMLNNLFIEFKKSLPRMREQYTVFPDGSIYDNINMNFADSLNKPIDSNIYSIAQKKMYIKYYIKEDNISEYRTGADKIIEDEHVSYGFTLSIYVDNFLFYEQSFCTDDFKYSNDPQKNKTQLIKHMEMIINGYVNVIVNTFISNVTSAYTKSVYETEKVYQPYNEGIPVYYGGKKDNKEKKDKKGKM